MSKGIVIIALGHPFYGRMAHHLSASIRICEPEIPIALIYTQEAISHLQSYDLSKTFDQLIEAPKESYTTNGKATYLKGKTFLYDLSPFDETLFFDADTVWLQQKKPSELFEELKDTTYSMANHEFFNVAEINDKTDIWGKIKPVKEAYQMTEGKYYSLSSEVIYFKRDEKVKEFFDTAKQVFENPRTQPKAFANYIPDEYAFSVAQVITGLYPHRSPWHPSYWFSWHPNKIPKQDELQNNYYLLSAGGKVNPQWVKMLYNRLVAAAFNRLELRYPWRIQNKRSFLTERTKI